MKRNAEMIEGYRRSCCLIKERIKELSAQRRTFIDSGRKDKADELMLDRRIFLLYTEHRDMEEVIGILTDKNGED